MELSENLKLCFVVILSMIMIMIHFLFSFFSVVTCGEPEVVLNSERRLTGSAYGSSVAYQCHHGYTPMGVLNRECQANGNWSGEPPQCIRN